MLVYVRDSYKEMVVTDVRREDIPERLQERLAEEKRIELAKKKERNEAHLYMQVNVLLETEFYNNYGQADLFDPMKVEATKLVYIQTHIYITNTSHFMSICTFINGNKLEKLIYSINFKPD